jgi:hypothetical protein
MPERQIQAKCSQAEEDYQQPADPEQQPASQGIHQSTRLEVDA